MTREKPRVAVIGGTGDLGSGLARQLLRAGYEVVIGSRSRERAGQAAQALAKNRPAAKVHGAANAAAAAEADIVIMAVPFTHHEATLLAIREQVQGKIVVDATVPLVPPKVTRVQLPAGGSAAKRAQELLGDGVRVVSAFQNIAAAHLNGEDLRDVACDVLVCGNDASAREAVVALAADLGLTAWHAGAIDNAVVAEALTSVLIFLNRKYKLDGAGIRIVANRAP
ncbi:MAG TPA: NADPH-dependent F420 reductase [Woeseiaceae bacterium]|nr:NADPH-dependent F420 reductase [Woeseiaceae bacterium]